VVLLGPQRFDPTLGATLKALGLEGKLATVTAGWQEREEEDSDLQEHLSGGSVNLRLYARAEEVWKADAELHEQHRSRQEVLRHKQDFYRIRLEHELEAAHVIDQRKAPPDILVAEQQASIDAIRALDDYHLAQCARVREAFELRVRPFERDVVRRHRDELRKILEGCVGLAIAGGQVATLLNRLELFGVDELLGDKPVFAWSAGAMVACERVVLFHDDPPQGPGAAEVLDRGLGLCRGVIPFPAPEQRLRLDDPERVARMARRMAPALCLGLPATAHVTWDSGILQRPHKVIRLQTDGSTEELPS
jgi:hypothetical protein